MITEEGEVVKEKFLESFKSIIPEEQLEERVKTCTAKKATPELTSFNIFKCTHDLMAQP